MGKKGGIGMGEEGKEGRKEGKKLKKHLPSEQLNLSSSFTPVGHAHEYPTGGGAARQRWLHPPFPRWQGVSAGGCWAGSYT